MSCDTLQEAGEVHIADIPAEEVSMPAVWDVEGEVVVEWRIDEAVVIRERVVAKELGSLVEAPSC